MKKYDIFITNKNKHFIFNGYAYENEDGIIILDINTIPFNKKFIIINSKSLYEV